MCNKKDYHYFAASWNGWSVGEDLDALIAKQKKADTQGKRFRARSCNVYKVPLNIKSSYGIEDYKPNVPGVAFVKRVLY